MAKLSKDYDNAIVVLQDDNGAELAKLSIAELSDDIVRKLAVYGAFVKIQRSTAGLDTEEQKVQAMKRAIEALRNGQWSAGGGSKGSSKKQAVLEEIKNTDKRIRQQFVQALQVAGVIKRLGITEEELKEALNAP